LSKPDLILKLYVFIGVISLMTDKKVVLAKTVKINIWRHITFLQLQRHTSIEIKYILFALKYELKVSLPFQCTMFLSLARPHSLPEVSIVSFDRKSDTHMKYLRKLTS